MALLTAGTSTSTVLRALAWNQNMNATDLAALNALATHEYSTSVTTKPTPIYTQGMLWYPERGSLKLFPGDYLVGDPVSGAFFIVNADAFTGGSFVHS